MLLCLKKSAIRNRHMVSSGCSCEHRFGAIVWDVAGYWVNSFCYSTILDTNVGVKRGKFTPVLPQRIMLTLPPVRGQGQPRPRWTTLLRQLPGDNSKHSQSSHAKRLFHYIRGRLGKKTRHNQRESDYGIDYRDCRKILCGL
jgi:hypothetical protein